MGIAIPGKTVFLIETAPWILWKQGKSEGFDSCDRPSNLAQIWSKSSILPARVILKFDEWPWKIIGHLFYTTSSFVRHFKSIGALKLKLQSRNTQFRWKLAIFLSRVTLKFDGWPWKTIGHLFYTTSSFVHHFKAMGEFKLKLQYGNSQFGSKWAFFFVPCDLQIWWMTLENNRAPLVYYWHQALCIIS